MYNVITGRSLIIIFSENFVGPMVLLFVFHVHILLHKMGRLKEKLDQLIIS